MYDHARFHPIYQLDDLRLEELRRLYQNEWWTQGRTLEEIEAGMRHSDLLFGICETSSDRLVAFARVLTDRIFKAFLFDIIVHPEYRGQGLGKSLIGDILNHPDLQSVRHFELYCQAEMVPYYERWGFSTDVGSVLLLRRELAADA